MTVTLSLHFAPLPKQILAQSGLDQCKMNIGLIGFQIFQTSTFKHRNPFGYGGRQILAYVGISPFPGCDSQVTMPDGTNQSEKSQHDAPHSTG